MNGERKDKACLKMLFGIVPKDMSNLPKQIQTQITDFTYNLKDPVFAKISAPINTTLNVDVKLSEFDDDKVLFPSNIAELPPKMPDVQSMEVDPIESDKDVTKSFLSSQDNQLESDDQISNSTTSADSSEFSPENVRVQCLESMSSLEEKCKKEGLIFNASEYEEDDEESYEIDLIYAHKEEEGETYYLVKWKNYSTASNTWEPSWHLDNCAEMVEFYHAMKDKTKKKVTKNILNYFVRDLISRKPYDMLTLIKVCALCSGTSEKYVSTLKLSLADLKTKAKSILTYSPKRLKKIEEKLFYIMQYGEARKRVLINLKEWEDEINAADPSKPLVTVENNVDLERCPSDFKFVQDYINTVNSAPPEPVAFCSCEEDCYNSRDACCPKDSDGRFAYNRYKRLILEPGYPIFECNDKCSCPPTCTNRIVQHGQKVKVTIFRTRQKGWGLKAQETIERGQFVLEYLGEIITSEVAEERGRIYDYVARSYLFDLDYGVDNASCSYTVDAGHVGNVAHFINHSCDPNLHVFAVWINQQDPNLPRLAFFAKRRISKGEELTFDYKMCKDRFNDDSSEEDDRIPCRCESQNCRKYLF